MMDKLFLHVLLQCQKDQLGITGKETRPPHAPGLEICSVPLPAG